MVFKFNKFERAAGIFVGLALVIFIFSVFYLGVKQRWFTSKVDYIAYYKEGDGLYPGTSVTCAGVTAGHVKTVGIDEDNRIRVVLSVYEEFTNKIKIDSVARIMRPFIISDKVIYISAGSKDKPLLSPFSEIQTEESFELTDLLSGGKLTTHLKKFSVYFDTLQVLMDSFVKRQKKSDIFAMYDEIVPTLRSVQMMQQDITEIKKDFILTQDVQTLVRNVASLTDHESKQLIKNLNNVTDSSTQKLLKDMALLTGELSKFSGDIPKMNQAISKTLEELRVTLKALQKTWILRSNVKEVKDEEGK